MRADEPMRKKRRHVGSTKLNTAKAKREHGLGNLSSHSRRRRRPRGS